MRRNVALTFVSLLVVWLLVGTAVAVRRSGGDDEDHSVYDEPAPANDYTAASDDRASQESSAGAEYRENESGEGEQTKTGEEKPPQQSLAASFVPVIAIMFASKTFPSLSAGGSTMPMLMSVLMVPRAMPMAQNFLGLQNLVPGSTESLLLLALVSIGQYAMIVNIGQGLGYFKDPKDATLGKPAASVSELTYVQGEPVDVQRPKSVKVVEFWATWCGPCERAIPHLNEMWKKLQGEFGKDAVQFVGVTNESADKVQAFIQDKMQGKMEYPVALDPAGSLNAEYPTQGIPHCYVVDTKGVIVYCGHPMAEQGQALNNAIRKALRPPAPATATSKPAAASPAKPKVEHLD